MPTLTMLVSVIVVLSGRKIVNQYHILNNRIVDQSSKNVGQNLHSCILKVSKLLSKESNLLMTVFDKDSGVIHNSNQSVIIQVGLIQLNLVGKQILMVNTEL